MPPRPARASALTGATLLALLLTACQAPANPGPSPSPTRTADAADAPIFESDEEALAAAVEAYERYVALSSAITAGQADPEEIRQVVVPGEWIDGVLEEYAALRDNGLRTSGASTLSKVRVAEVARDGEVAAVSFYACRDVSATRVVNAAGEDLTPPDRDTVGPIQVFTEGDSTDLTLTRVELWSGADFCA